MKKSVLLLCLLALGLMACSVASLHGEHDVRANEGANSPQSEGEEFKATMVEFSERVVIGSAIAKVFPLLDPVRESEWIPGWEATMISSESGFAEEGAIFQTFLHGDVLETWAISEYVPLEKVVFIRFNPNFVTRLSIELLDGNDHTQLTWTQRQVALNDIGNRHLSELNQEEYSASINNFGAMLNYFLNNGEMIDSDSLDSSPLDH